MRVHVRTGGSSAGSAAVIHPEKDRDRHHQHRGPRQGQDHRRRYRRRAGGSETLP